MKDYADKKRHTAPSKMIPGDHVLARQRKIDKLTPPYNPDPYTIVEKKGSMVTAAKEGHSITRNSSNFKRVIAPDMPKEEEFTLSDTSADTQELSDDSLLPSVPSQPVSPITIPSAPRRNPSRSAGMPRKFADYDMG